MLLQRRLELHQHLLLQRLGEVELGGVKSLRDLRWQQAASAVASAPASDHEGADCLAAGYKEQPEPQFVCNCRKNLCATTRPSMLRDSRDECMRRGRFSTGCHIDLVDAELGEAFLEGAAFMYIS